MLLPLPTVITDSIHCTTKLKQMLHFFNWYSEVVRLRCRVMTYSTLLLLQFTFPLFFTNNKQKVFFE